MEVDEGKESQQFWNAIGGEEQYFTGRKSKVIFHMAQGGCRSHVWNIIVVHVDQMMI